MSEGTFSSRETHIMLQSFSFLFVVETFDCITFEQDINVCDCGTPWTSLLPFCIFFNTYHAMSIFNRRQTDYIFLFLRRK